MGCLETVGREGRHVDGMGWDRTGQGRAGTWIGKYSM